MVMTIISTFKVTHTHRHSNTYRWKEGVPGGVNIEKKRETDITENIKFNLGQTTGMFVRTDGPCICTILCSPKGQNKVYNIQIEIDEGMNV